MTDRTSQRKGAKTTVVTEETRSAGIDAAEEKVVRMRHGFGAPDDLVLEQVGQDNPDIAARLREIELRALEMSGRMDELRAEVGLEDEDAAVDVPTKDKIVSRLSEKLSSDD